MTTPPPHQLTPRVVADLLLDTTPWLSCEECFERLDTHFEAALALFLKEDSTRVLLFGGGFTRDALLQLCRSEIRQLGGPA